MQKLSEKLIAKYGEPRQIAKVCEELSELSVALLRVQDKPFSATKEERQNILEEYCDVVLVLNHIDTIFDFPEEDLKNMFQKKFLKAKTYLENSKNGK